MSNDIQKYADKAMYPAEPVLREGDDLTRVRPRVFLVSATPDPLGSIAAACMMYEGKVCRYVRDVTDEQREYYWEQVQKTHLQAPLEFVDFHFLIEGVTRAWTHQLVRQRTAVYAQESLRFAVKEGMADEVPLPPSLQAMMDAHDPDFEEEPGEVQIWTDAMAGIEKAYEDLINLGIPAEEARGLLPHSVTTRVHYKTNLRGLVDHAGNRLCTQAQFEWREVFTEIVNAIKNYDGAWSSTGTGIPPAENMNHQFQVIAASNLFRPVCYKMGKCPFTADFDRGCKIRPRVEAGRFDEIDIREWLLDSAAAREKA